MVRLSCLSQAATQERSCRDRNHGRMSKQRLCHSKTPVRRTPVDAFFSRGFHRSGKTHDVFPIRPGTRGALSAGVPCLHAAQQPSGNGGKAERSPHTAARTPRKQSIAAESRFPDRPPTAAVPLLGWLPVPPVPDTSLSALAASPVHGAAQDPDSACAPND